MQWFANLINPYFSHDTTNRTYPMFKLRKCIILRKKTRSFWFWWQEHVSKSWDRAMFTSSGNWEEQLQDFWERNVSFLSVLGIWLLNNPPLSCFWFHNDLRVFSWWKVWTAGRPFQHPGSPIMKPSWCDGCSMQFNYAYLHCNYILQCKRKSQANENLLPTVNDQQRNLNLNTAVYYKYEKYRYWFLETNRSA